MAFQCPQTGTGHIRSRKQMYPRFERIINSNYFMTKHHRSQIRPELTYIDRVAFPQTAYNSADRAISLDSCGVSEPETDY